MSRIIRMKGCKSQKPLLKATVTKGSDGRRFPRILREYTKENNPHMVALLETRVSESKADRIIERTGYDMSYRVEATGFSSGIWLIWNNSLPDGVVLAAHPQFVHVSIEWNKPPYHFFVTIVYDHPDRTKRKALWSDLQNIQVAEDSPWLYWLVIISLLARNEKKRGANRCKGCKHFLEIMDNFNLVDLGFKGSQYTWNRAGIFERLDRIIANNQWNDFAPHYSVQHLYRIKLDHRPILLLPA
ncbi:uncharacterized protein LOC120197111 [Hibiscus syriacus]|uniref:uncharacterized protein LOC120197111 n=1 Tax=Hibiscus syriacus TaxID=106335 RepID=UPI001923F715|nr:uncharacterized protein LOC120197111 [Hibiscus syriacus]